MQSLVLCRSVRDRFRSPATDQPSPVPDLAALARGTSTSTPTRSLSSPTYIPQLMRRGGMRGASHSLDPALLLDRFLALRDSLGYQLQQLHGNNDSHSDAMVTRIFVEKCSIVALRRRGQPWPVGRDWPKTSRPTSGVPVPVNLGPKASLRRA
ncbi:hypothetical protein EDB87DRAFT_1825485 [Lactarius vividus]|nr:hypothetical protein EDB87DRAFT_1825485 [Lactarius vividus]